MTNARGVLWFVIVLSAWYGGGCEGGSPPGTPTTQPTVAAGDHGDALSPPARPPEVRFFGVADRATKVVYVCDRSASMATTFPYVQAELVRSINELNPTQRFHVIFFFDVKPMELRIADKTQLHPVSPENNKAAKMWVEDIMGSPPMPTDARPALERAFKVAGGPPEVIFLLTDGLLPEETVKRVADLNAGRKVRVHTILFVDRMPEAEKLLRVITRENGGKFRFVDEDELGGDYR